MERAIEPSEGNKGLEFSETDWRDFSFQIGRKSVGGDSNTKNPNTSNYRSGEWLNLMTSKTRLRKDGIRSLRDGIMSVVKERKDTGIGELDENGLFPLRLLADYLINDIEPKISNRGRHGDESIAKLKILIAALFLGDQTPRSIAQITSSLFLKNHKR